MTTHIEVQTVVRAPAPAMFEAARSIDEHLLSMKSTGERAVDGVMAGPIGLGEQVTWIARHFGVRWRMTSLITQMSVADSFTDEQIRGPFKSFRHEHVFLSEADGCRMVDRVHFEAPFGPLGAFAEKYVLKSYLTQLLVTRGHSLAVRVLAAQ